MNLTMGGVPPLSFHLVAIGRSVDYLCLTLNLAFNTPVGGGFGRYPGIAPKSTHSDEISKYFVLTMLV